MHPAVRKDPVVGRPVEWIRENSSKPARQCRTQVPAPGICGLAADSTYRPKRDLRVERMVVVTGVVRDEIYAGELRIGHDEVLGVSVVPEYLAIDEGCNRRQPGIQSGRIVQGVERV